MALSDVEHRRDAARTHRHADRKLELTGAAAFGSHGPEVCPVRSENHDAVRVSVHDVQVAGLVRAHVGDTDGCEGLGTLIRAAKREKRFERPLQWPIDGRRRHDLDARRVDTRDARGGVGPMAAAAARCVAPAPAMADRK